MLRAAKVGELWENNRKARWEICGQTANLSVQTKGSCYKTPPMSDFIVSPGSF